MARPVLELESLGVEIDSVPLLRDVSLKMNEGEVLAVIGPNGAGKSTLVRAMCGEQPLSSGHVRFGGCPVQHWDARARARHLAVLPQRSYLNFPFTSAEVVALARTPHSTGAHKDAHLVAEVLEYLDAAHLAHRLYTQLSGGEQQRIQFARVLTQIWHPGDNTRLLLLDEPSAYFDLAHQQLLVKVVHQMAARGVGIVLVLHDLNLAISCADRIAVLCCGELRALGPVHQVLTEALIRDVFGIETQVASDHQSGLPYVRLLVPGELEK